MAEIIVAWSGGKDSTLTLQALQKSIAFEPVGLLTTITSDYDRISMHGVRTSLLRTQAKSLGLPLIESIIPAKSDNESYEPAMEIALDEIRALAERFIADGFEAVAVCVDTKQIDGSFP